MEKIISFHSGNINKRVLDAQRRMFYHIGLNIEQTMTPLHRDGVPIHDHGMGLDAIISAFPKEVETVAVFDIDAFCSDRNFLRQAQNDCMIADTADQVMIIGGAHNANHTRSPDGWLEKDYASPACCVFSMKTFWKVWDFLGGDVFKCWHNPDTDRCWDCGQRFSDSVRRLGGEVRLIYPTTVREPHWPLHLPDHFLGHGTDYGPFYHEFQSSAHSEKLISEFEKAVERRIRRG